MKENHDDTEATPSDEKPDLKTSVGKSFADFYFSDNNPEKSLPQSETSVAVGAKAVTHILAMLPSTPNSESYPTDRGEIFAEKVSEMAHSKDFIEDFSERVGLPAEDESEDAFVKRAKTILRELLRSRFR